MAKRRKVQSSLGAFPDAARPEPACADVSDVATVAPPASHRQRVIASGLICAHFLALLMTLSANLAPSYLQGQLARLLAPYLVTTSQAYNAYPLELTHAEPFDFPLYLELRPSDAASDRWDKLTLPGISSPTASSSPWRFSRWSNLSRMIRLIFVEQPDSEILSDITAHLVEVAEQQNGESYSEVRWIAPKVLSYDEDARMASGEAALMDEGVSPSIVYRAVVVHATAGQLSLVPQQAPLRTAKPTPPGEPRP